MKLVYLMVFLVLISSTAFGYSDYVIVENYPFKNPNWDDGNYFFDDNRIRINGYVYEEETDPKYGEFNEELYRGKLVHEIVHVLCLKLFGDVDVNHERCFTEEYNNGWSKY